MNKIHKTLAIAAAAMIAGINVWNVQNTSAEMDLLFGDVEHMAVAQTEYQFNMSAQYGGWETVFETSYNTSNGQWSAGATTTAPNGASGSYVYSNQNGHTWTGSLPPINTRNSSYQISGSGSYNPNTGGGSIVVTVKCIFGKGKCEGK